MSNSGTENVWFAELDLEVIRRTLASAGLYTAQKRNRYKRRLKLLSSRHRPADGKTAAWKGRQMYGSEEPSMHPETYRE